VEHKMLTVVDYLNNIIEPSEIELTKLSTSDKLVDSETPVVDMKRRIYDDLILTFNETLKDGLTTDDLYYCRRYIDIWFSKRVHTINKLYHKRTLIRNNLLSLKELKLPEQRSKEWYEIREHLLTASSLADALGKGHFQTRDDLLMSKTSEQKNTISKASRDIMQWGVKYEPVATEFYEYLNNLKIIEFGLIPHPELSVFGASPDGICDIGSPHGYESRMLEIKCPPKRNFTKDVPKHYWMQMQGQLEVCDLEECDFFQVKLEEYSNVNEYEIDILQDNGIVHGKTTDGLPKGLLIAYHVQGTDDILYKYSPFLASLDTILNWKNQTLKEIKDHVIYEMKWWKITRYECTLVRRDPEWWISVVPDIIKFWNDVVHYRKVGNEAVQKRIDGRKRGPRKKIFTIEEPIKGYLMDD
jgi:putative phage-type endonuclease